MASKKEILATAEAILAKHGVDASTDLYKEGIELWEPKKGGQTLDITEFTKTNAEGLVTEIQCRLSGVWLPATTEFFPADKNAKFETESGELVYHTSKQALKIKSDFAKAVKASKEAISNDVLNEEMTAAEGREAIENLPTEPDYSVVTSEVAVAE